MPQETNFDGSYKTVQVFADVQVPADGLLLEYDQWGWQRFEKNIDAYFENHQTARRHHALHDAKALRDAWLLMQP